MQALTQANTPRTKEVVREIGEKLFRDLTESQAMELKQRYATMKLVDLYTFIAEQAIPAIERLDALRHQPRTASAQKTVNRFLDMHEAALAEQLSKVAFDTGETVRGLANRSVAPDPRPDNERSFLAWLFGL